jgi:ATP-dependent helicase HrpA
MELQARLLPGFVFAQHVAELIADRALTPENIPRSRVEFEACTAVARGRIGLAVQDVAKLLGPLLEAYHQARLALEQQRASRWQYALDDMHEQLDHLTPPGFLVATPWPWLQHCPRYLRAIPFRLEAIRGGSLERDREHCEEIRRRWQAYVQRGEENRQLGLDDPELAKYRWMLEEYRVSLFAQRLGTSVPVSAKRLDQQWSKVGKGSG